jgi:hypothetical protein
MKRSEKSDETIGEKDGKLREYSFGHLLLELGI